MEAQNAVESDQTKPAGATSQQQRQKDTASKPPQDTQDVTTESPSKGTRRRASSGAASGDRDSDAETIVLPGKDGHSPSKVRKVRQEDRSDGDMDASKRPSKPPATAVDESTSHGGTNDEPAASSRKDGGPSKKKRLSGSHEKDRDNTARAKDESSVLSSAPTSPSQKRRRPSVNSHSSQSDTDQQAGERKGSKSTLREKVRSGERLLPHKRKVPRTDSDEDDDDSRKARRQRTTSSGFDSGRTHKERRASMSSRHRQDMRNRSNSPPTFSHRRSASNQLASSNGSGSGLKKKRLPPPLQPTDYLSDDSSASGSPHPRAHKSRTMAASSNTDAHPSPVKVPSHKKHLDAHGQTLLARACARGEFEGAKQRLADRPEDLNVADYAGNTPLQIAAINGCEDIVELLVDAGCNLDCVNYDKDTPLLDAVDNGHLGVIKLLLNAGVNPRKANVNGEEPIDRVTEETDNADEIRAALIEAKKRFGGRTKTSEDRNSHLDPDGPDSPRHSPAAAMAAISSSRRGGAVRSTKTRNDLLYQPLDDKTLRQAAGRGDEEMVARILQVKGSCSDAEPMVAAARGGHDLVIQLLLGLGGADPDPEPIPSQPSDFATPILAAIGQENLNVLELLLEQQSVDPTRRHHGETYYEIAKRRQGTNWKEEEQILKNAYDAYKSSSKSKTKSPGRRERERDREEKRARRADRGETRPSKAEPASPPRDEDFRRKLPSKMTSPREKRRSETHQSLGDEKRNSTRQKKDERTSSLHPSDRELSPVSHKHGKTKRTDSEIAMSSEGESVKPRRKLVSKGELRGERDKRRRSSVTSTTSTLKEPSSPRETRHDESVDRSKKTEKYHDRAKALKREESKDLPSGSDSSTKRHRASVTPDRSHQSDKDDNTEGPSKRRRLESEALERRNKKHQSSNEDAASRKPAPGTDGTTRAQSQSHDQMDTDGKNGSAGPQRKESRNTVGSESSVQIKSEDVDVEMPDADIRNEPETKKTDAHPGGSSDRKKKDGVSRADGEGQSDAERKRVETEEKKKKQQEAQEEARAKKLKEEEDAAAAAEAEAAAAAAAAQKQKEEEEEREAERKRKEEAERKQKEEEEKRLAEEKARQEAEEKARQEEEERRREEERKKKEEEERKKREEEELRLQKEREAAEEARRKREEEERKERERRERLHREEMERKRAAREAEQRRIREEQEKERLDKLPPLLRWLDTCANPKSPAYAEKFKTLQGVRYDTIRPDANRTPEGREQWVLNTHVALLLGEKDLDLSRCK